MNMRVPVSALCCIMAVVASSHALAQDLDEAERQNGDAHSLAERPQPPAWEASIETTWLPGNRVHDTGGDLAIGELNVGLARRFSISPRLELSTGLHYSLREFDAPAAARLPASLHALAIDLGVEYRANDSLTLGIRASPGLSSDFKAFATNDVRVPVSLHARYQMSRSLSFLGGIAYSGQNRSLPPVLPVLGVLYEPSDKWAFAFGFPRTGVFFRPNKKTALSLAGEFSGGEFRLHESSMKANVMSYRDYRAISGAEVQLLPFATLGISGGYAFGKTFVFHEWDRSDVKVDGAPFGRVSLKVTW